MIVILYGSLLVSQAMEQVTRSLYARGDLDLVGAGLPQDVGQHRDLPRS